MHTSKTSVFAFSQAVIVVALLAAVAPAAGGDAADCLIITEIVLGNESGEHPRWMEITNTGLEDYTFTEGGVIVQEDDSSDTTVDINLAQLDVTIQAGQAYVICSTADGGSGAFYAVYGQHADLYVGDGIPFGDGNDRFILTDTGDGSNLLDIYGEFGVNGTGEPWEYTLGYSYRLAAYNSGNDGVFVPEEWYFGGVDSLKGNGQPSWELMLMYTNPGRHAYDEDCIACPGDLDGDNDIDLADLAQLLGNYGTTSGAEYTDGDIDLDGDVDLADLAALLGVYGTSC